MGANNSTIPTKRQAQKEPRLSIKRNRTIKLMKEVNRVADNRSLDSDNLSSKFEDDEQLQGFWELDKEEVLKKYSEEDDLIDISKKDHKLNFKRKDEQKSEQLDFLSSRRSQKNKSNQSNQSRNFNLSNPIAGSMLKNKKYSNSNIALVIFLI